MSKTDCKAAKDMTEAMETTMQRLQGRFQAVSEQLESKNELGRNRDHPNDFKLLTGILRVPGLKLAEFEADGTMDQMGTRIDDLKKNVTELMTQSGMEEQPASECLQADASSV